MIGDLKQEIEKLKLENKQLRNIKIDVKTKPIIASWASDGTITNKLMYDKYIIPVIFYTL